MNKLKMKNLTYISSLKLKWILEIRIKFFFLYLNHIIY